LPPAGEAAIMRHCHNSQGGMSRRANPTNHGSQ
jgi:hypothetical protein